MSRPPLPPARRSPRSAAGSLQWYDPDSKSTFVYNNGDIAWTLASTALVWIMVPGVGFFYSGLLRRKNALSMIFISMMTLAVVSFQVRPPRPTGAHAHPARSGSSGGAHPAPSRRPVRRPLTPRSFSLTFSDSAGRFIGDLSKLRPVSPRAPLTRPPAAHFGLMGVLEKPSIGSTRIPTIVFCIYQLMFAAITSVPAPPRPAPADADPPPAR